MLVSVVVPAYNAASTIEPCLQALVRQFGYGPGRASEIIVVDDGSTDSTSSIIKLFPFRYVYQRNQGPAAARNTGWRLAKGDIVLFTDADCVPSPTWVQEMVRPFENPSVMGVKGAYRTRQSSLMARIVQLEFEAKYRELRRYPAIQFVDGYSAGYRRSILEQFGGFDERFTQPSCEDIALSFRVAQTGYQLVFAPNAIVYHRHPTSLWDYLRRKARNIYWATTLYRAMPRRFVYDSYTAWSTKIQLLLCPLAVLILILPVHTTWTAALWVVWLLTILPWIWHSFKLDGTATLLAPAVLFARSCVQAWAVGLAVLRKPS